MDLPRNSQPSQQTPRLDPFLVITIMSQASMNLDGGAYALTLFFVGQVIKTILLTENSELLRWLLLAWHFIPGSAAGQVR